MKHSLTSCTYAVLAGLWFTLYTDRTVAQSNLKRAAEPSSPSVKAPTTTRTGRTQKGQTFTLRVGNVWRLQIATLERFDASALLRLPNGSFCTVNDRVPLVYQIQFRSNGDTADLVPAPDLFSIDPLYRPDQPPPKRHDVEGLAWDSQGRIYVCEESTRRILRYDPSAKSGEVLPIDWAPVRRYFDPKDSNASFEGIAVGEKTLYVANEREVGRIIAVDLRTFQITDHFQVAPFERQARDVHYSDLSWFDGQLWVLCRESRCVLKVDAKSHQVLAEYDYANVETSRSDGYFNPYPGYGFVEGLSVDAQSIWLAVDNNGFHRLADREDKRPTLFRCPRPDVK